MRTLNEPTWGDDDRDRDVWTPAIGLRRGARIGALVALAFILATLPVAATLPYMLVITWLRCPLAFGLAWLLMRVVDDAAGMTGHACAALAVALTAAVLLSHHIAFAIYGIPSAADADPWWVPPMAIIESIHPATEGLVIGWTWLRPDLLAAMNLIPLLGAAAAAWIRGRA